MSPARDPQIQQLLSQAAGLEVGPSKVAVLEEAVRLADTQGDRHLGYAIRQDLIEATTFSGYPEKALVAFSWCLAQCDQDPEHFRENSLLWKYKWIVHSPCGFPQISRQQMEEMLEDMTRRFQRAGSTLRAVYKLRCDMAVDMGERQAARKYLRQWEKAPRDWLADCPACECDDRVDFFIFTGQDEQAVAHAAPILNGHLSCMEIPHRTLARVLLPLVRLGRVEEAMRYHHRGYPMIARNREFVHHVASHLTFLALTDNLGKAVKLFEKHLPWALDMADLSRRFDFYLAARFLMDRLAASGKDTIRLRLPSTFAAYQESGNYEVSILAKWFAGELRELARRFDERNGNRYFTRRIGRYRKLREFVSPCPLREDK